MSNPSETIVLITVQERNERTGRMETIVSHGVNTITQKNVILPCETPQALGAKFDKTLKEWTLS